MDGRKQPWWQDATGAGGTFRDDELIMAVIEAAKAWHHYWSTGGPGGWNGPGRQFRLSDDIIDAVEALRAAEKGE